MNIFVFHPAMLSVGELQVLRIAHAGNDAFVDFIIQYPGWKVINN